MRVKSTPKRFCLELPRVSFGINDRQDNFNCSKTKSSKTKEVPEPHAEPLDLRVRTRSPGKENRRPPERNEAGEVEIRSVDQYQILSEGHPKPRSLKKQQNVKFVCEVCHREYTRRDNLSRHFHLHQNPNRFVCIVCGKGFVRRDIYTTHLKVHEKAVFFCTICREFLKGELNYRTHVTRSHFASCA